MKGRRLGDLTLARAVEMVMPFDRQFFFPDTTPAEWAPYEGWLKPGAMDPKTNALLFTVQSYVVRTSHHTILIDSCVGNHKERANRPLWHQKTDDSYMQALASLGLAPDNIDYVMCTHLHADHVGWNTRLEGGRWVPTFPNARYVFTRKELEAWQQGHLARAEPRPHPGPRLDPPRLERTRGRDDRRSHALAGAMPASRMDGLAGLGRGAGQADAARVPRALCRDRHAGLHRPLPVALGGSDRRAGRRLPLSDRSGLVAPLLAGAWPTWPAWAARLPRRMP
jgi:Metallo-beta-lactamase superfamily